MGREVNVFCLFVEQNKINYEGFVLLIQTTNKTNKFLLNLTLSLTYIQQFLNKNKKLKLYLQNQFVKLLKSLFFGQCWIKLSLEVITLFRWGGDRKERINLMWPKLAGMNGTSIA